MMLLNYVAQCLEYRPIQQVLFLIAIMVVFQFYVFLVQCYSIFIETGQSSRHLKMHSNTDLTLINWSFTPAPSSPSEAL